MKKMLLLSILASSLLVGCGYPIMLDGADIHTRYGSLGIDIPPTCPPPPACYPAPSRPPIVIHPSIVIDGGRHHYGYRSYRNYGRDHYGRYYDRYSRSGRRYLH